MSLHQQIAGGEPDTAWIIAAHEAGRADPDPFYGEEQ